MPGPLRPLPLLLLPLWLGAACTRTHPAPRPAAKPVAVRPAPTCPAALPQSRLLEVSALWPLAGLDLRPRYVERMQLADRTLERQRYKVMISGEKNWKEHFFLAVLLWRMAEVEEKQWKVPPAHDAPAKDVLEYRRALRTIQNYRTESLLHLDYLYHLPNITPAALERLAYYTAHLQGAAAIPFFYKLLEHPKVPDFRYYVLDFAGLLLSDGRCAEAGSLLGRGVPADQAARGVLTEALVRVCRPPEDAAGWRTVCAKLPEGAWHDFIPILARGLWLTGAGTPPDPRGLAGICPQLAADGARTEHFRHVFAALDREWRPKPMVTPVSLSAGDDALFAALTPALREFAAILLFLKPRATEWTVAFVGGRWSLSLPGETPEPALVRLLVEALPILPPSRPGCPAFVTWNVRTKGPGQRPAPPVK